MKFKMRHCEFSSVYELEQTHKTLILYLSCYTVKFSLYEIQLIQRIKQCDFSTTQGYFLNKTLKKFECSAIINIIIQQQPVTYKCTLSLYESFGLFVLHWEQIGCIRSCIKVFLFPFIQFQSNQFLSVCRRLFHCIQFVQELLIGPSVSVCLQELLPEER